MDKRLIAVALSGLMLSPEFQRPRSYYLPTVPKLPSYPRLSAGKISRRHRGSVANLVGKPFAEPSIGRDLPEGFLWKQDAAGDAWRIYHV